MCDKHFEPLAAHTKTSRMLENRKILRIEYINNIMLVYTSDTVFSLHPGQTKWKTVYQNSLLCRDDGTINPKAPGLQKMRKRLLK